MLTRFDTTGRDCKCATKNGLCFKNWVIWIESTLIQQRKRETFWLLHGCTLTTVNETEYRKKSICLSWIGRSANGFYKWKMVLLAQEEEDPFWLSSNLEQSWLVFVSMNMTATFSQIRSNVLSGDVVFSQLWINLNVRTLSVPALCQCWNAFPRTAIAIFMHKRQPWFSCWEFALCNYTLQLQVVITCPWGLSSFSGVKVPIDDIVFWMICLQVRSKTRGQTLMS